MTVEHADILDRNLAALDDRRPAVAALLRARRAGPPRAVASTPTTASQLVQAFGLEHHAAVAGIGDGHLLPLLAARPRGADGSTYAVYLCEPDLDRLLAGLASHDLAGPGDAIAADHVMWFVGPDWAAAYAAAMRDNPMLPPPAIKVRLGVDAVEADAVWTAAVEARVAAEQAAQTRATRWANSRSDADVAAMLRGGTGCEPPRTPRALLFTSRFTTVLRHSLAATADALTAIGWDVFVVTEQHDHERLTMGAVVAAMAAFEPDLLLTIDHHRHEYPAIPPGVPFVGWIQDDLPHLTAPDVGGRLGPRDFAVGTWMHRYVAEWGYPPARCVNLPRLTAARPVPAGEAGEDLVYVANHSVEPRIALDELAGLTGRATPGARAALATGERLLALYESGGALALPRDLRALLDATAREQGMIPEAAWLHTVTELLFLRINNPLYRQQGLAWARDAAATRGLTLGVYGVGWERHRIFGDCARGPVAYGPALWRLTAAARCNLRLEPYPAMSHQRLIDGCAAGGFFLSRRLGAWEEPEHAFVEFFLAHLAGRAATADAARGRLDEAGAVELARRRAGLVAVLPQLADVDLVAHYDRRLRQGTLVDFDRWPLPPGYFATVFGDAAELGRRLDTFVADAAARQKIARGQQAFVAKRHGHAAGLRPLLAELAERLGAGAARPAVPAETVA